MKKEKEKEEYVVLVDEKNDVLGTMPKKSAHDKNTPLHRGFSVFLFNSEGELLLQQRSIKKKTWPLVWSNSCCGHPMLDETPEDAAKRRLRHEIGIRKAKIFMIIPDYRYKTEKDGIMENEICPIMVAFSDEKINANTDEVESVRWIRWDIFLEDIKANPGAYSPWCVEEAGLLEENDRFKDFMRNPYEKTYNT